MEELLNQMGKRILERRKQLRLTQEGLAKTFCGNLRSPQAGESLQVSPSFTF